MKKETLAKKHTSGIYTVLEQLIKIDKIMQLSITSGEIRDIFE